MGTSDADVTDLTRLGRGGEQAHQAGGGHVGGKKGKILSSGGMGKGFGREVSAAYSAFHGGGPAGSSPVAGEKYARPRRDRHGTVCIDAGARRVGGVHFLDHGGFDHVGLAGSREKFADFRQGEVDDLRTGF